MRCDFVDSADRAWQAPPPANGCMLGGWGTSFDLRETVGFGCVGDTILPLAGTGQDWTSWHVDGQDATMQRPNDPEVYAVLDYGQSIQTGDMVCNSEQAGVTCTNHATGAGFFVSRESYEFFGPLTPTTNPSSSQAADLRQVTQAGFASPSGRIVCSLAAGGARCDYWDFSSPVTDRGPKWELPPKPESCVMDWGDSLTLGQSASLTCHGDAIYPVADVDQPANADNIAWFDSTRDTVTQVNGLSLAVLGYGQTLQAGPIQCSSQTTGVTCTNSDTGAGFTISQESYRIF